MYWKILRLILLDRRLYMLSTKMYLLISAMESPKSLLKHITLENYKDRVCYSIMICPWRKCSKTKMFINMNVSYTAKEKYIRHLCIYSLEEKEMQRHATTFLQRWQLESKLTKNCIWHSILNWLCPMQKGQREKSRRMRITRSRFPIWVWLIWRRDSMVSYRQSVH